MKKYGTAVSSGVLVIASVFAFQGCMPDTLVVGNNPGGAGEAESGDSGAAAGTGGQGGPSAGTGGSGPRAGRGGRAGSGPSAGTGGSGPRAGAGGSAPRAGSGGTDATAGTGGSVAGSGGTGPGGTGPGGSGPGAGTGPSAGTGSSAGAGGEGSAPFVFDGACSCSAVGAHEFSCTLDRLSLDSRITVPNSCEAGLDYVHRNDCGQGFSTYRWEDHGSEYSVGVHIGLLTSMKAVGGVGAICGIDDPIYRTGTIATDPPPPELGAPDECPACSACDGPGADGSTSALPRCEPCDDTTFEGTYETIADFCQFHNCPADLAAAETSLGAKCPSSPSANYMDSSVQTGCGLIGVRRQFGGDLVEAYYFDSQTHTLVGALLSNDLAWGTCGSFAYFGGTVPSSGDRCADASTCTLCAYPSDDVPEGSSAPPPACTD